METVFIRMNELKLRLNRTVTQFNNELIEIILCNFYIQGLLRLTVHNCTQADVGKYTCRIYNPHGEDVCHAELVYDSMLTNELSSLGT